MTDIATNLTVDSMGEGNYCGRTADFAAIRQLNVPQMKNQIKEIYKINETQLEGDFESLERRIEAWKGQGWEGIELGACDPYEYYEYSLYKHRPETEEEYNERLKLIEKEKKREMDAKKRRRKEYEKLRKEFEVCDEQG